MSQRPPKLTPFSRGFNRLCAGRLARVLAKRAAQRWAHVDGFSFECFYNKNATDTRDNYCVIRHIKHNSSFVRWQKNGSEESKFTGYLSEWVEFFFVNFYCFFEYIDSEFNWKICLLNGSRYCIVFKILYIQSFFFYAVSK